MHFRAISLDYRVRFNFDIFFFSHLLLKMLDNFCYFAKLFAIFSFEVFEAVVEQANAHLHEVENYDVFSNDLMNNTR